MPKTCTLGIVVLLATGALSEGDDTTSPAFSFVLMDGTIVTGVLDAENLTVETPYGDLKVSPSDVESFIPGLNSHSELADCVGALLAELNSSDARQRQQAQNELVELGSWLEPIIVGWAEDQPSERKLLVQQVLDVYKKADRVAPAESLGWQDKVQTKRFPIVGRITDARLRIHCHNGRLDVKLADIRRARSTRGNWLAECKWACDHVIVELCDGTQIKGKTDVARIALTTAYGAVAIPLSRVLTITPNKDDATATVKLHGGDLLRGAVDLVELVVKRGSGPVHIPTSDIARIDVFAGDLDTGLAHYWAFDDQVAVDLVRGVRGEILGHVVFEDGILGKAPVFKNYSTKIVVQSPDLNLDGWKHVTLSTWVKMKGYSTYGRVVSWAEGSQGCGVGLRVGGNYGYWTGAVFNISRERDHGISVISRMWGKNVKPYPKKNIWHHLVGTYDGRRVRFYINGVLDAEEMAETPGLPLRDFPEAKMVIGRAAGTKHDSWRDTYFPGLIDEVKIWNRALTAGEVRQLYEQTLQKSRVNSRIWTKRAMAIPPE